MSGKIKFYLYSILGISWNSNFNQKIKKLQIFGVIDVNENNIRSNRTDRFNAFGQLFKGRSTSKSSYPE
jgi:hypothetical protein